MTYGIKGLAACPCEDGGEADKHLLGCKRGELVMDSCSGENTQLKGSLQPDRLQLLCNAFTKALNSNSPSPSPCLSLTLHSPGGLLHLCLLLNDVIDYDVTGK